MTSPDLATCLAALNKAEAAHNESLALTEKMRLAVEKCKSRLAVFVPQPPHSKDTLACTDGSIRVVAGYEIITIHAYSRRDSVRSPFTRSVSITREKIHGVVSSEELAHP